MITNFFRKFFKLPTKKEREELDFYSLACNHLMMDQIYRIIEIVNEEIEETRKKFGHKIEAEDAAQERKIILLIVNATGGTISLRRRIRDLGHPYWNGIINIILKNLAPQIKKYFSKEEISGRSRIWYNCHITVTVSRILNEIVNEKFPPP